MTRRSFLSVVPTATLAARNWERSAFPDWSPEFIDKMLTDSPWARPMTLPFRFSAPSQRPQPLTSEFAQLGGPPVGLPQGWPGSTTPGTGTRGPRIEDGNAPPVRTEIYLTTRWSSALPVRQALAIQQYGRGGLGDSRAESLLRGEEGFYVVEIAGFPAGMIPQGVRRFEAQLLQSASLSVKGRKPIHGSAASVPEYGNHLIATLRFPRIENLLESDGFIEFAAEAGPMQINQKFKLHEMIYKGRLEL